MSSSDDIVDRLRLSDGFRTRIYDDGLPAIVPDTNLMHEAADEIERLRAELNRFYPAEDVELFSPHIERACAKPPTLTVWFRDE